MRVIKQRVIPLGVHVLATRDVDGLPTKPWAIGEVESKELDSKMRVVYTIKGNNKFGRGLPRYYRVKPISKEREAFMLLNRKNINRQTRSVWWWARCNMHNVLP